MVEVEYISVAGDLDNAGLLWQPEIGDEISLREKLGSISVLVDPQGMTPRELRSTYLWLPKLEQLIEQIEARQAILAHAGLEIGSGYLHYKTIIEYKAGKIEAKAESLRLSVGFALRDLLHNKGWLNFH